VEITVNGERHPWRETLNIAGLLDELGLTGKRVAIELNGQIIPRSQHAQYPLNAGDNIEIIQAIGGG
jgi:sulfur carrier protein